MPESLETSDARQLRCSQQNADVLGSDWNSGFTTVAEYKTALAIGDLLGAGEWLTSMLDADSGNLFEEAAQESPLPFR